MKDPNELKRLKRAKTLEEIAVEEALLFGTLFALIPLAIFVLLTPLAVFLSSLGAAGALCGYVITFMSLSALCSGFWGIRFGFSYRQFGLLAKFILAFNGGISALSVIYSYLIFTVLAGLISIRNSPVIGIVGVINLLLIVLLILLRRALGEHVSKWFRIKYIPANASIDLASKFIEKAERELASKNYEVSGEAFHAAAVAYVNLGKWKEAGEEYLRAADIYSMEKDMAFGASFMYGLAAASFILGKSIENANRAIERAEKILELEKMPDKAKKRVSDILTLLTTICNGESEKAEESWKSLRRKVIRWGYPIVEETILLMERNIETLRSCSGS